MDDPPIETGADAETAHKIGHRSARSARIEVITGNDRRRTWTLEQKREIVAPPGVTEPKAGSGKRRPPCTASCADAIHAKNELRNDRGQFPPWHAGSIPRWSSAGFCQRSRQQV